MYKFRDWVEAGLELEEFLEMCFVNLDLLILLLRSLRMDPAGAPMVGWPFKLCLRLRLVDVRGLFHEAMLGTSGSVIW